MNISNLLQKIYTSYPKIWRLLENFNKLDEQCLESFAVVGINNKEPVFLFNDEYRIENLSVLYIILKDFFEKKNIFFFIENRKNPIIEYRYEIKFYADDGITELQRPVIWETDKNKVISDVILKACEILE